MNDRYLPGGTTDLYVLPRDVVKVVFTKHNETLKEYNVSRGISSNV